MKINKLVYICMIYLCLLSCSSAKNQSIKIPDDERQRLSISYLNFTGADFFKAYMSKDVGQRRLAEMYLIGVLDSTEGKTWCGYNVALPGSLQEQLYLGFKKAPKDTLNQRASEIISFILSNKLPCKDRE